MILSFKPFSRYIIYLLLLDTLVIVAGFLLVTLTKIGLLYSDIALLTICFSIITLISLFIFFRGRKKEPDSQTMHLLVSVSLRLPLELVLALVWFFIAKKTTTAALLIFFILYLAFSCFSILFILNTLKHKSLLNQSD